MKVYLNDPIAESALERLRAHVTLVSDFERPEELDAIIGRQQHVTREVIECAAKCKLIQQHGVGLDRIDLEAAKEAGIPVRNTPGVNARSVAEYTVAMMLDLSRRVAYVDKLTRKGELTGFGMAQTVRRDLAGKRLGLVGSGNIAQQVAQICRDGFRMDLSCYDPFRPAEDLRALGLEHVETLGELFATCDFVSLHCLLTPESYHMVGREELRSARPGLVLVNTAHGGLVDEEALYEALSDGTVAAAGLDTFEQEPPSTDSPLLSLDNFLAGMHVAGSTVEAMEANGKAVVDNVFEALGIVE